MSSNITGENNHYICEGFSNVHLFNIPLLLTYVENNANTFCINCGKRFSENDPKIKCAKKTCERYYHVRCYKVSNIKKCHLDLTKNNAK